MSRYKIFVMAYADDCFLVEELLDKVCAEHVNPSLKHNSGENDCVIFYPNGKYNFKKTQNDLRFKETIVEIQDNKCPFIVIPDNEFTADLVQANFPKHTKIVSELNARELASAMLEFGLTELKAEILSKSIEGDK